MYILLFITNKKKKAKKKKNMSQNEIKDLIFKVSKLSTFFLLKLFPMRDIYYIHKERRYGGFKIYCVFMGSFAFIQKNYC